MIEKILAYANKRGCSDIHITSGNAPTIRVDGDIIPIPNAPVFTSEQILAILHSLIREDQKKTFEEKWELDFSIQVSTSLRYRGNAFFTIYGPGLVFREIPTIIKSLTELGAPSAISQLSRFKNGLILVVGPTGSGKTTTLAGLIDHINDHHPYHIVTIEDPVEFVHKSKKSLINQREIGNNTKSFANALRGALREDPDVILVGELRDVETIELALIAAETGHLVLATMHTSSAAQTINRIISVFNSDDKPSIRSMVSNSIRGVISQRLIKRQGGGRCAAYEIMLANSSVRNLIREDKVAQINSIIEINKKSGMILMRDSVNELLANGVISKETADEVLVVSSE